MVGHLKNIYPSVLNHLKQHQRSVRISSPDNICVLSKYSHTTALILVLITIFINCSVYIHSDFSVHEKAQIEYAQSGVAPHFFLQHRLGTKIISAGFNSANNKDRCFVSFTKQLQTISFCNTYREHTAYALYNVHRLTWCNAPPQANLQSQHRVL